MSREIELKLLVEPAQKEAVLALCQQLAGNAPTVMVLANSYFDTPDLQLRHFDIGLRIRQREQQREQTVKLAGEVTAGIHSRPEYNCDITADTPDLTLFDDSIWPTQFPLATIQAQLQCLFQTNFTRHRWQLPSGQGCIELVFDEGWVIAGARQQQICEIELEVQGGELTDALRTARVFMTAVGAQLGSLSKAARGYLLAGLSQLQPLAPLRCSTHFMQRHPPSGIYQGVATALNHWQHHDTCLREAPSEVALQGVATGLEWCAHSVQLLGSLDTQLLPLGQRLAHYQHQFAQLAARQDVAGAVQLRGALDYQLILLDVAALLQQPPDERLQRAYVVQISEFVERVLTQQTTGVQWCDGNVQLPASTTYGNELRQQLAQCQNEQQAQLLLRHVRQRWYATLAAADLLQQLSLTDMLEHLTATADALIEEALAWLYPRYCERYGTPRTECGSAMPLWVIGMGKLGGRELNFSSDIDVIFCYPEQGVSDHERRPLENSVFFTRLAQGLVGLLDTITADGRVFRVDLRLRPFGQSGPLVASLSALESYYQEQGRDWERYAMVKARLIGADRAMQQPLQQLLRPFVYRRYIDFSAIDALRKMKSLITQETRRQGYEWNIKLGPGGIREIEFIAQAFQLIRGGQQRQLQTHSLYQAYQALAEQGLLAPEAVQELLDCYQVLRKIEHVLQQLNDEQTQQLPTDPQLQRRVSLALHQPWPAVERLVKATMATVHQHFMQVIGQPDERDEEAGAYQLLWQDMVEDETALAVLMESNVAAPEAEQIWQTIRQLRAEVRRRSSGPRGRQAMARLVPLLLEELMQLEQPEQVVMRVVHVLQKIMTRTAYVELLVENQGARQQLIKLCQASAWLTKQLAQYPLLLDELIDPQHLYDLPQLTDYPAQLDEYLMRLPEQELELQMDALRQARQVLQLKIAAADISGGLPLMKVSDHLSYLAEAMIAKVVHLAWHQLTERHGQPPGRDANNMGFAVFAYGKLGGLELSYSSDLDLVFITDSDYQGETDGVKPIEVQQFYLRLAQRILHLFTARTMIGSLYDVDMRLRPSGNAGLLVTRLTTFASYLTEDAWTWELQALVRARAIFGHPDLVNALAALRVDQLCQRRDEETLQQEVITMRDKMRSHQASHDPSSDEHVKQAKGGMTDLEFLVQYLVLRFAKEYPSLTQYSDNVRILEQCAGNGLFSEAQAQQLIDAYLAEREVAHQLALENAGKVGDDHLAMHRQAVQQAWRVWLGDHSA
ncbi:glutamate-ammonia-ligase adenylyltransferase [Pseudidiomarina indica]|uniref:Bifunctional glutamine synthetase adenylyltransferase/adenylyl-removing enzyme n=1 Tax=Pseudidiomarina indica TaxID=1159017 RepID=A0A1G6B2M2_9GAMM|nr:bifunctional [glutamate--ammonia ligase]-adenylyl-L-tyrosine phosphorylase/[glutamate--ammonia-ligase] adenylyltransferase [Pseudidiomarina indica]SDB14941.1 glutamate-ammonia-ligase adenylyltransferase [Pseudidiomarina indica]